jgi:hypothetical protein
LIGTSAMLTKEERQILFFAGQGSMTEGIRELIVIYRDLWALGYRPTVPVKLFVRRYKKKGPRRAPKEMALTASPEYNPEQGGQ